MSSTATRVFRPGPTPHQFQHHLQAFVDYLRRCDFTENTISSLWRSARHLLVWLHQEGVAIVSVDDAVLRRFRHHECGCAGTLPSRRKETTVYPRPLMTGALKLVQYLEDTGHIPHPGDLHEGLTLLEDFIARRAIDGYAAATLAYWRGVCRHLLFWMHRSRIPMREVDSDVVEQFLGHDCVCPGCSRNFGSLRYDPQYVRPFVEFAQYLTDRGVLHHRTVVPETARDTSLDGFGEWLRRHRGIGAERIRDHKRNVSTLLARLGQDPEGYNAARIRAALLARFEGVSWGHAQTLATSMQMYLRYLAARGICSPTLVDAVPRGRVWKLASLPRYLPAEAIEQVIRCCDVTTPVGLRDRAILLLLARLGLRAGDIVRLRLDDIDWHNAIIRVCGKSRRQVGLPLPQDAGDAVLAYIEQARPRVAEDQVFLRAKAPHRPFACSGTVSARVKSALKRAGMSEVRPRGSHLFRHSTATNLVRSGVSLDVIGALLRHRSLDTTAIYAKTDRPMLLEVAQPWIGDLPCT